MITFKIQGAKYKLPTAWADVTYSQYIALLSLPNSLIEYINLFTKIGTDKLLKSELRNLEKISLALSFINIPFEPKEGATGLIGKYYAPKDVTIESLGQFEDLRGLLKRVPPDIKENKESLNLYCELCLEACAIYCQKIRDGKYDSNKIGELKDELREANCVEIIQSGSFFLSKPLRTSMSMRHRFQMIWQHLKKSLLDLPGYQKSLDFLQHSSKQGKE